MHYRWVSFSPTPKTREDGHSTERMEGRAAEEEVGLSEPPQQLSATELHIRIALLEHAAQACRARSLLSLLVHLCRAELESRPGRLDSDAMPDEIQQFIFRKLCNAFDPRSAVAFSSASKGLREPMQRVDEGAGKSPLQQLKEENAAAAALGRKVGARSCKALREAKTVSWGLSAIGLATLGKLTPMQPALETFGAVDWPASYGVQLVEALGVGALPAVTFFGLYNVCVGDAGASALAAALDRGALPRLKELYLRDIAIGDAGLLVLAPALRRLPALEVLALYGNPFGDKGLAALVAPPPAEAQPPQADALAKLKMLNLGGTLITDVGCADLASKLPALVGLGLDNTTDISDAARAAVLAAIGQRRAP